MRIVSNKNVFHHSRQEEDKQTSQSEKKLRKKLEDALEKVRQNPNLADAHYNLGWEYDEQGQYKEAIASYKEAIRIRVLGL